MDLGYAGLVAGLVAAIPAGQVLSYGDVAEILEAGGPRQVAAVMSRGGGGPVPWWRVVRADGTLPQRLHEEALAEYRVEGTPLTRRLAVDMRRARWTPGHDTLEAYRHARASQTVRRP